MSSQYSFNIFFLKQQIQELEATLYNALQQDKVSTSTFISNTFLGGDSPLK